jgi:hypothetical protein
MREAAQIEHNRENGSTLKEKELMLWVKEGIETIDHKASLYNAEMLTWYNLVR